MIFKSSPMVVLKTARGSRLWNCGFYAVRQRRYSRVEVANELPKWLIGAFAVLTLGELMLSPMGLALVAKVSPKRYLALMMGGWFVATAIGNKLTMIRFAAD